MTDPGLVRALGLFVPAAAVFALWLWRRPGERDAAAALLACAWNFAALALAQPLASRFGWWQFDAQGGLFLGMPVELLVGWVLLWGIVPVLALPRAPLAVVVAAAGWLDLLLMPGATPVVRLGPRWLVGEVVVLALALFPSLLLARWTARDERVGARALLQAVAFTGLVLGVVPAAVLSLTGGSWRALANRPGGPTSLLLQALALVAVPGLSAVQEFAQRGAGTPLPYDPPKRLVTTGPYAYVANPMQVAMCLVLLVWGMALASPWVAGAALVAFAYGAGLAAWDEGETLRDRHGAAWERYRAAVRNWLP